MEHLCLKISKIHFLLFVHRNYLFICFHKFRPTYLDSILYGYLSILYKAPFVGTSLKSHLISCQNLCLLIRRINTDYFPLSTQGIYFYN